MIKKIQILGNIGENQENLCQFLEKKTYLFLTDTLSCFIRGQKALDLTGTATTEGWDFTIESAESETLTPGKYKTQFVIFEFGTDRKTLGTTELIVCPSFEKLTVLETRTADEIELEAVTQAIAKHSNGIKEYWIGDRKMEYRNLIESSERFSRLLQGTTHHKFN